MKTRTLPPPQPARRRLLLALPSGALLASPLALVGCGGGGDDDAVPNAEAALALPAGIDAKDVTLVGPSTEQPAGGASASVPMNGSGPALVCAVHASDRLVAMGLLRAGATGQTLGARSSAEALLFLALGGSQLGADDRTRLLDLLRTEASVTALAGAIEARWSADPFALDGPDAQIVAAVTTAVAGLRGSAEAARATGAPARKRAAAVQPLQRIEPSAAQSGVTLLQADGSDGAPGIKLQNTKRRRGIAHVYETSYTPVDGEKIELGLAQAHERIDVPPTQALSIFSAIGQVVGGTVPWAPVETARRGLTMHAGAEETVYETVYLTPVWDRPEPGFFLDVRYSLARSDWREELKAMYAASQLELVLGAVLEALGLGGQAIAAATLDQSIAAIRAGASATPNVMALLEQAGAGQGLLAGWRAWLINVSEGNAIVSGAYRVAVATVVRQANAQLASNIEAGNLSARRLTQFRAAIRVLLGVAVVAGVADTAAQYRDLHEGESGNLYTSTLVAPKVLVSPSSGRVQRGGELKLTARVSGAQQLPLVFAWSMSGSDLANLRDASGHAGRSFETGDDAVTLATTPSTQGTLSISVEAFVVQGGTRSSVGTATATIEVDQTSVTISPAASRMARTGGTQAFSVSVQPAPTDGNTLVYDWTCASSYGSLASDGKTTSASAPLITGSLASASYSGRGDNEGGTWETIKVQAYALEPGGGRRALGEASAEVYIKQEYELLLTPGDCDVAAGLTLPMFASFEQQPPAGSSVDWTWSHSGVGTLTPGSGTAPSSQASLATGSAEGSMTVTVQAVINLPGGRSFRPLPLTRALRVKKGTREITMVAPGGVFPCGTGCGVSDYSAYIVPRIANAIGYRAVFTGFGYGPCNRSVSWVSEKPDGGGCNFPITYHPFQAREAASFWAVWIGFGGPIGEGTCTVTITLPA